MTFIRDSASALARFPARAQINLRGGRQPEVGQTICRPGSARTLRQIASEGGETLYAGALARTIVADIRANGGLISLDDLAEYRVIERTPVRREYHGYEIVSTAPPSSGGMHILQMLNVLSTLLSVAKVWSLAQRHTCICWQNASKLHSPTGARTWRIRTAYTFRWMT